MTRDELPDQADPLHEKLEEAVNETGYLMDRIRAMARDLRPPALDVTGLNDALQDHCEEFARRTGLNIEYKGTAQNELTEAAQICLYRVLQEALTNIAKHARAKQVQVSLERNSSEHHVSLIVRDNGLGFDTQILAAVGSDRPQGIGVSGMKERVEMLGGRFEIKSKPGEGTLLVASLPAEVEKNDQGNSG
jgi:signal transduction histidine kinase